MLLKTRVLAAAAVLALSACSAVPPTAPSTPAPASAATAAPAGGVLLSDLGLKNAPAGFSVPATSVLSTDADSPNNVTISFAQPSAADLQGYLRQHLPEMGFTITADTEGSMLFENATHDGAFTSADGISALSLRTDRE